MQLCFYRGTGFVSWFIRWWTSSPYSHVEFRFINGRHWGAVMGRGSGWLSPSDPDLVLDIPGEPYEEARLLDWCEIERDCPYDWLGVFLSQLLNRARSTRNAWFCSEACTAGLLHLRSLPVWLKPCTVSPGRLEQIWAQVLSSA